MVVGTKVVRLAILLIIKKKRWPDPIFTFLKTYISKKVKNTDYQGLVDKIDKK